jgi:hypothetical protein
VQEAVSEAVAKAFEWKPYEPPHLRNAADAAPAAPVPPSVAGLPPGSFAKVANAGIEVACSECDWHARALTTLALQAAIDEHLKAKHPKKFRARQIMRDARAVGADPVTAEALAVNPDVADDFIDVLADKRRTPPPPATESGRPGPGLSPSSKINPGDVARAPLATVPPKTVRITGGGDAAVPDGWMTTTAARDEIGCGQSVLHKAIAQGRLPSRAIPNPGRGPATRHILAEQVVAEAAAYFAEHGRLTARRNARVTA